MIKFYLSDKNVLKPFYEWEGIFKVDKSYTVFKKFLDKHGELDNYLTSQGWTIFTLNENLTIDCVYSSVMKKEKHYMVSLNTLLSNVTYFLDYIKKQHGLSEKEIVKYEIEVYDSFKEDYFFVGTIGNFFNRIFEALK